MRDDERLKNLVIFNTPLTDKEMEEISPAVIIGVLILLVIMGVVAYFKI